MKDELDEKITKELVGLRTKRYSYLTDNEDEVKKAKGTKNFFMKRKLKFKDFKNFLKATQFENKIN